MSEWNTEALIDTSGHFLTPAQTLPEWQVLNPKLQIPNKGSNPKVQKGGLSRVICRNRTDVAPLGFERLNFTWELGFGVLEKWRTKLHNPGATNRCYPFGI